MRLLSLLAWLRRVVLSATIVGLSIALLGTRAAAASDLGTPLLRFPDSSKDATVFVARGALWIAPRHGGRATALTDDAGQVFLPRFSPEGRTIAFTWRRGGSEDVWLVSRTGGPPRQLTHGPSSGPYDNMVVGWTPDGRDVLFLSQREARFTARDVAAYAVPATGGLAIRLAPENAGLLSVAPDGHALAYDRTFRTFGGDRWKRYVGGQAPKIFVLDTRRRLRHALAPSPGADTAPMWWRDRIYFLSDRGPERRLNLWVTNESGRSARQVTHITDDDIDVPALGHDAIDFGEDGRLWRLELPSETLHEITVALPPPPERIRNRSVSLVANLRDEDGSRIADASLSPDGGSAVLSSFGQLVAIDGQGVVRVLTTDRTADEDKPAVSPDGRMLAFVTMAEGDAEIALRPLAGGLVRVLTHVAGLVFHAPLWSPDGRLLAVADAEHGLWLVRTDGGGAIRIAADRIADIRDAAFSPDGTRLAWSTTRETGGHALHLLDRATGRQTLLSNPLEDDRDPVFTSDGKGILFLSARREFPVLADRDDGPDIVTTESDGLYQVALPVAPFDATAEHGLTDDALPLPVDPGVLNAVSVRGDTAFYETSPINLVAGTLPGEPASLHALNLATGSSRIVAAGTDPILSANGRTALLRENGRFARIDVASGRSTPLAPADSRLLIDPAAAWRKDLDEAWHLDRALFWDPHLNGVDWAAIGRHAASLAAHIESHEDAVYVLGNMQGELSASHLFVEGGDDVGRPAGATALLGIDFAADARAQRYRIARIYEGDSSRPRFRSPLAATAARTNDLVIAINGEDLRLGDDPYRLLVGGGNQVTLLLASKLGAPTRKVTVTPVESEVALRQLDWIRHNRAVVTALSQGRIGYVFVSDFAEAGTTDFDRQYYAQTDKAGLVIDDRWNRGGFTSQWVIGVLGRRPAGFFRDRQGGVTKLPGSLHPPALVIITNIFSQSDGDQFPFFMQRFGLARVIGERTWGGVSGIDQLWTLLDGTSITIPKDRLFASDGTPILENQGAEPDILIHDEPSQLAVGMDAQLESAVRDVVRRISLTAGGLRKAR